jgi:hypothetical protein
MSTIHADGLEIEMHRDVIDVTPMSEPDEKWRFVDAAGHVHVWVKVQDRNIVPTTKGVVAGYYEDGEPYYESRCCDCLERVQPGMVSVTTRQFMPGMAYYRINGVTVSEVEAKYAAKAGVRLAPEALRHATGQRDEAE